MVTIYLSFRAFGNNHGKLAVHNINLQENVWQLQNTAAKYSKLKVNEIGFVHSGVFINESRTLANLGISSGSVIHCVMKQQKQKNQCVKFSIIETQQLLVALRSAMSSPNYRSLVQNLRQPDTLQNILSAIPAAMSDTASLAFLLDVHLFASLTRPENLNMVLESHPTVGLIALYIMSDILPYIHKKASEPGSSVALPTFSLDAVSDDDDDEPMDMEPISANSRTSSVSVPQITPAQLAAALSVASGGPSGSSSSRRRILSPLTPQSIPTTPRGVTTTPFNTPSSGGAASASVSPLISQEMFARSLQNALSASSTTVRPPPSPATVAIPNVDESLQLMREMGLPDDTINRRALAATNGDLQAAVNLIFAQWSTDD